MITLCIDTSFKYLIVALIDGDKVIDSYCELCPKKQSEYLLTTIDELCKRNNIKPLDINQVCVTKGPGSYTGVRIGMSVAKVMCSLAKLPLYTINTLDLISKPNSLVVMDARSNRAYYGIYDKDNNRLALGVDEVSNLAHYTTDYDVLGDGSLFDLEDNYPNLAQRFLEKRKSWELVENVHTLVPTYLKDNTSYMVKK